VDGWPHVNGYASTAAIHMLSRIQVLIRHQRNRAKYDYTHVTMAVKRCGIVVAAPSHLPLPPGPHPPSTAESRPTNTSTSLILPSHARQPMPRQRQSPTSCVRHPQPPGHGQQKQPIATTGADITAARLDFICVCYTAVHAIVIKDKQQHLTECC